MANTKLLQQSCEQGDLLSCTFYHRARLKHEQSIFRQEAIVTAGLPLPPYILGPVPTQEELQEQPEQWKRSLKTLDSICQKDIGLACETKAHFFVQRIFGKSNPFGDPDQVAEPLVKKACALKFDQACTTLAELQRIKAYDDKRFLTDAEKTLHFACETLLYGEACKRWAQHFINEQSKQASSKAASILQNSCKTLQHGPSCSLLGTMYYEGWTGFSKDLDQGVSFTKLACDYKDPVGCGNLSYFYATGTGIIKDKTLALKQAKFACEKSGGQKACSNLGLLYWEKAQKETKYVDLAKQAWNRGCLFGDGASCVHLGKFYLSQTQNDFGFLYMKQSCHPWYSEGCYELGLLYKEGQVVTQNCQEAKKAFERSCEIDANSKGCSETCTSKIPPRPVGESCKAQKDGEADFLCMKGSFCEEYGTDKICTVWCNVDQDCPTSEKVSMICDLSICRKKGHQKAREICDKNHHCNEKTTCSVDQESSVAICKAFGSKTLGENCQGVLDCQRENFCFENLEKTSFCSRRCEQDQDCQNRERPMKCRYLATPPPNIPEQYNHRFPFFKMCVKTCRSDQDCSPRLKCIQNACVINVEP